MKASDAYPSKYLKPADIKDGGETRIIADYTIEVMGKDREQKPVLRFVGLDKALPLNATNNNTLIEGYGDETDFWPGQPVFLHVVDGEFAGKPFRGIRLKVPPRKPKARGDDMGGDRIPY